MPMALAADKLASSRSSVKHASMTSRPLPCKFAPLPFRPASACRSSKAVTVRATDNQVEQQDVKQSTPVAQASSSDSWVPVCKAEDLPKGVRKEMEVDGRQVLLFWYRNQLYCIEGRSPAEGAYSEGFIKAKFTQDYCIECPGTASLFSLKDGSIVSWYPKNPVLRTLTPAALCRPLEIYPVKLTADAIYVDVTRGNLGNVKPVTSRGGADTSFESNNVFTVQPTVYFEGMDPAVESASLYQEKTGFKEAVNPAVALTGVFAVGIVGVIGTAIALYYEDLVLLAAFWLVLGGGVAFTGYKYVNRNAAEDKKQ